MSRPKEWFQYHAAKMEADTADLTLEEFGAYQRLLNFHFLRDSIPSDIKRLSLILRVSPQKARKLWAVLSYFFHEKDGRFYQKRMQKSIAKAIEISEKRKKAGQAGGIANAKANYQANVKTVTDTVTSKEKRETKKKTPAPRKTRLPSDWQPSQKLIDYCQQKRPDLDPATTLENFRDYYLSHGKPMADWDLTAMRWIRNERKQHSTGKETAAQRRDRQAREAIQAVRSG